MMMRTFLTTAAILAAGAAWADMTAVDTDGDGMASMAEVQAVYPDVTEETFTTIDTNADTMLDDAEMQAAMDAGTLPAS